jgi:hypothetical protein
MRKIYLVARYSKRLEMVQHARTLESLGYIITSKWITEVYDNPTAAENYQQAAEEDYENISEANILLFFAEPPEASSKTGGRHVEFGIALVLDLEIFVVGPKENIFHYLDNVKHFETFDEVLYFLENRMNVIKTGKVKYDKI